MRSSSLLLNTVLAAALLCLFSAPPAEAAFIGASAVYYQTGGNPPVVGFGGRLCTYYATLQCACGWAGSPMVEACSEGSYEDALLWARAACFQYCQKNDPWNFGMPGPTGIYSVTGTIGTPAGVLHASAPGVFQAYVPGSPEAIGQSSDFNALASLLARTTGASSCWLSGPIAFFNSAAATTASAQPDTTKPHAATDPHIGNSISCSSLQSTPCFLPRGSSVSCLDDAGNDSVCYCDHSLRGGPDQWLCQV